MYNPTWKSQNHLWSARRNHPAFCAGSSPLPERCDSRAWQAALGSQNFESGHNAVMLSAEIHMVKKRPHRNATPIRLELRPLHLEQSCRLYRRFGSDRFIELLFPSASSPSSSNATLRREGGSEVVTPWLTERRHALVGREWAAFWTGNAIKKTSSHDAVTWGPEPESIFRDRVWLFAEKGTALRASRLLLPRSIPSPVRASCSRESMLDWLLNFERNTSKTLLKLFSRVKLGEFGHWSSECRPAYTDHNPYQGLSKTTPV